MGVIIRLDVLFELNDVLDENPFFLLEIDCNQLPNWQTLAQHTAPQSVRDKIADFVNNNSGNSSINTPVKNRPDWDKVDEVLQGERPISDLGCN